MKRSLIISCFMILLFTSCTKTDNLVETLFPFGWNGTDNPSTIPSSVGNIGLGNPNLPTAYDLSQYLPPIGNQGEYGTCVGWSVGYYTKSATEAIALNRTAADLNSPANQISPKDLFTAIPDSKKGAADCNGTNFTDALDILQSRGAANLQTVPYSGITNCYSSNVQAGWTANAAQHKIKYYRKIEKSVNSIKEQIYNKLPVMFGAKVYSNFQSWNTGNVYSSLSGSFQGNHAITIVGYDNNIGPAGAFKVVNSWGNTWGSAGFVWVDYNFLISQFSLGDNFYIMANNDGNVTPVQPPNTSGVDVAPWAFSDYSNYPVSGISNERKISLNIYNIGSQSLTTTPGWAFYYIYYNAYNANDYGVLFYDEFNTSVATGTYNCPTTQNCVFNYSIPANSDFASVIFGSGSILRTYYVPDITGYYYLMLYADPTAVITEQNEQNNVFYTTSQYPASFNHGYTNKQKGPAGMEEEFSFKNDLSVNSQSLKRNQYNSAVSRSVPNAYTPQEILFFLKKQKQSGMLDRKLAEFKHASTPNKKPY